MKNDIMIPSNFKSAMNSPQSKFWYEAMKDEFKTIKDRHVWDLVEKPQNIKILGSRWVFNLKKNANGEVERYKVRLVAQGFHQIKGLNYEEVFNPVVNFSVIRLFFALLVGFLKWTNCQIDVKNAYLYAPLKEKIYMYQPKGFVDSEKPNHVCLLRKALYGLHQSGRQWFFELHGVLESLGFSKFKWANCIYHYKKNVILLLYVDDMVIFSKYNHLTEEIIKSLSSKFDLKVLGKTKKLLGVEFEEIKENLYIHQTNYINDVYSRFKKYNPPISSLPISKGILLSKEQCPATNSELEEMKKIPYRSLIGCISFLACRTRPDVMYAVNTLSQFQSQPGKYHWNVALRLLGYIYATKNLKLNLSNVSNISLKCFSDASFAANRDDRCSVGGYILFLDAIPVSWSTKKQKTVALSSMEAEFLSLTDASKELYWTKNILLELNKLQNCYNNECTLYSDNQSAIYFSNSPIENSKTKHINVKYHFVRNLIFKNVFKLKFIRSKENISDIFTKPPTKIELKSFVDKIFI